MTQSEDHNNEIEEQFTKQGDAYSRIDYVQEEEGLKKTVAFTKAGSTDVVLDLACGPGFVSFAFAKACAKVVGVDITEAFLNKAIARAEELGLDNVEFLRGDVNALEFPDDTFDISICRAAFHHFLDPLTVLTELKRVTKPGGKIAILDMLGPEDEAKAECHHRMEMLCDPTHAKAISLSAFTKMFETLNLSVLSQREGQTKYPASQWIAHGGPSKGNEDRIRAMLQQSLKDDSLGLPVWEEDGELYMAHNSCAFLVAVP
jgi:ubiquinone/menaquinone biosynthesis C-methylase UbiE